jgi:hypothetical protein
VAIYIIIQANVPNFSKHQNTQLVTLSSRVAFPQHDLNRDMDMDMDDLNEKENILVPQITSVLFKAAVIGKCELNLV